MRFTEKMSAIFLGMVIVIPLALLMHVESLHSQADRDQKAQQDRDIRNAIVQRRDKQMDELKRYVTDDIAAHSANRYTSLDAARDRADINARLRAIEATTQPATRP